MKGLKYYYEFEEFCESYVIKYIENGFVESDDWRFSHLSAPFNRLYIILEGEGVIWVDNKKMLLKEGNAYIIPSKIDFNCDTLQKIKKLYIHFTSNGPTMENIFARCDEVLVRSIDIKVYEQCYALIENGGASNYYRAKGLYNKLIYEFIDMFLVKSEAMSLERIDPKMKRIYEHVALVAPAKLRVTDIASEIGMSRSALSRYFKEQSGETLKGYIQKRLLIKAQTLLLTKDLTVQEIAYEIGYEDSLYFSKVFSKLSGHSPTEYRRLNLMLDK